MLSKEFQAVYNIFKMNFYASMCANSKELTMQEAFSLDIIYMLDNPTILGGGDGFETLCNLQPS